MEPSKEIISRSPVKGITAVSPSKGITIGSQAPDFSLVDYQDQPFTLSSFQGKKAVLLVFLRGFACKQSQWHLDGLKEDYTKFKESKVEVAAIGQHSKVEFYNMWKVMGLPFVGLPDEKEKVAKLYKQRIIFEERGRLPALFLVDKYGSVAFAHYCSNMYDIPANDKLLQALDKTKS
ncbi:MAG: redoxin domain-containing protein [Proteobacteria bacterium]|nr:redoxin domain-containing protein [Pseudomonadota bacterium]